MLTYHAYIGWHNVQPLTVDWPTLCACVHVYVACMAEVMGQLYWQGSRSLENVVGGHACPASKDVGWRQEELVACRSYCTKRPLRPDMPDFFPDMT